MEHPSLSCLPGECLSFKAQPRPVCPLVERGPPFSGAVKSGPLTSKQRPKEGEGLGGRGVSRGIMGTGRGGPAKGRAYAKTRGQGEQNVRALAVDASPPPSQALPPAAL